MQIKIEIANCPLNNLRYSGQALPILPFSDKATPKTPFLSGFDIHNKPVYGGKLQFAKSHILAKFDAPLTQP